MKLRVLCIIDSLRAAGSERMAVNIANGLAKNGVKTYLCASHRAGPLVDFIHPDVTSFVLGKRHAFDVVRFIRLYRYVKRERIDLIHAHSTSFFWAVFLKLLLPHLIVVWHDHYGLRIQGNSKLYDYLLRRFKHVLDYTIVVSEELKEYAINTLKMDLKKVCYIQNFPILSKAKGAFELDNFPIKISKNKLISVANIRPEKDHFLMLDAFSEVKKEFADAQLYLVGGYSTDAYLEKVMNYINDNPDIKNDVHYLGSRNDVIDLLETCDLALLSSQREGLPVSLLEYGLAGIPIVSTNVGDCGRVLQYGKFGSVVNEPNKESFSAAVLEKLRDKEAAKIQALEFQKEVIENYSESSVILALVKLYSELQERRVM